ncbi:alpha/beta hydrolase [Caballeronia hypogeia]|uniref:Alpha/beta hydrolase n=1 Tax=Caballeronia hypogeia TaxID=1777140 RepID=A0A158ASM9_9BURK|nr:alpha/beta hydrolase [Caballeronia hypogeia]SAK60037.1 alpha/beta hydrolase [Caballeronia hypogeia]
MLLIHGFPQNWWEWNRVLRPLGENFTLIVPDLRGVVFSDKVQSIGEDPVHVVGHDIGAMVAYAYAWQFPTRSLTVPRRVHSRRRRLGRDCLQFE